MEGKRIVLVRREKSMTRYRWTGAEPDGLFDVELAEDLGARWEGEELVTYDLEGFQEAFEMQQSDDFMIDND